MDPRNDFIAYIEDLARRHVDIAHDPTTEAGRRFFLETEYEKLLGGRKPDNTGFNLVLMGYETSMLDNRHGRRIENVQLIFDILKHVPQGDYDTLTTTQSQCRAIGEELLNRMKEQQDDPCNADVSDGIVVTYRLQWKSKRTIEVGPRFDHFYGYRFMADLYQDGISLASNPAKWRTLD